MVKMSNMTFNILIVSSLLFYIGVLGLVLNKKNLLKIIMSLEILLLSINLNFILFSTYLDDLTGQVFVIFVLALSAVESSIGLAFLSVFYEKNNNISFDLIKIKSKNLKF